MDEQTHSKLKLHGFNNLTKTLSFNIYDICYAQSSDQLHKYLEYIDEEYNADRLTRILMEVSNIIGAQILNIAHQDYDPQGASVTMLISEGHDTELAQTSTEAPGPAGKDVVRATDEDLLAVSQPVDVVAHMDKSHITVHTYPESHPHGGISTFRADIDVATCGQISPLKALNHLIHSFESDIVIMDYRVRGFTRDVDGEKHYIDHEINSIQNFIGDDIRKRYEMIDVNIYQENIFHTKMILNEFDIDSYLFEIDKEDLSIEEQEEIHNRLQKEMGEIFQGRNH